MTRLLAWIASWLCFRVAIRLLDTDPGVSAGLFQDSYELCRIHRLKRGPWVVHPEMEIEV